ncbi:choice-of-anchor J domain-containing protein [candidate division WOR-3 bacterium]|nr:choice-of-anchor J domain-containing protein [candidate division WOR-3 bacterium]
MILFIFFIHCAWTESFETQNYFPPNDWIIVNKDGLDACWYRAATEGHTGTHSATCYADTAYSGLAYTNLDYIITPQVLPNTSDSLLSFWYSATTSAGCSLDIMVSTVSPFAMPSFNLIQTFYVTETSWTQQTVNLSSYNGVSVYIGFRIRNIPISEQVYLDDIGLPDMTAQPTICNGRLRTKGPPVQKYLQVWGSHYEMGYAHGFLLGEGAMANLIRFAIGSTNLHMLTPTEYEYGILPYFRLRFYIPQKYQDEAQGAYDGIVAKGVDLTHPELGRDITAEDILCLNALDDFGIFWCSSISGWGESTVNDDTLQGGMVIARNLDFSTGQYTSLGNTSVIIACSPDASDEQDFILVSMAGLFGCLSGVNKQGVGLCSNYGNHPDTAYIPLNSLVPLGLSCRDAIETVDPDSNGINDIFDIIHAIHDSTCLMSWDVHLFSSYDASHPVPAGILEINNIGDSLRLVSDNSIPPAINSDWNLCVTNHDRVYHPPEYCYRYQVMADSLNNDFHLTTERAIAIENAVAGWSYFAGTVQSMVFRPNLIPEHPDWPFIGVSYAYRNQGAHTHYKHYYSWNELFEGVPGIKEKTAKPIKNHSQGATIISGPLLLPADKKCKVFDITGREVKSHLLRPGIYFVEIDGELTTKVIKIR